MSLLRQGKAEARGHQKQNGMLTIVYSKKIRAEYDGFFLTESTEQIAYHYTWSMRSLWIFGIF